MPSTPQGQTICSWETLEYPHYERGILWYVITSIIALALIIYGIVTSNFLFSIIILIFALIVALTIARHPETIEVQVTETGIVVSASFYSFSEITHFAIIYDPPDVKKLYLELKGPRLNSHTSVHLGEQNPVELRAILLSARVPENAAHLEEPFLELLARLLKF